MARLSRRRLGQQLGVSLAALVVASVTRSSSAQPSDDEPSDDESGGEGGEPKPHPQALPELPLSIAVAEIDGKPVVTDAWIAAQIAEARRLMPQHGIVVAQHERHVLAGKAALDTAEDRDDLHTNIVAQRINVFVVHKLRDVDDPELFRMGVRWRLRRNPSRDYIIVAASARGATTCHELGHYFGNGHSTVENNVMSYKHTDPAKLFFDRHQGAKMRRTVAKLLATGKLRTLAQLTAERDAAPPSESS